MASKDNKVMTPTLPTCEEVGQRQKVRHRQLLVGFSPFLLAVHFCGLGYVPVKH